MLATKTFTFVPMISQFNFPLYIHQTLIEEMLALAENNVVNIYAKPAPAHHL